MTEDLSLGEKVFYKRFDVARHEAGNLEAREISRLIREVLGPEANVPEETIRDWIKRRRLPRSGDKGDRDFLAVIQVLRAEKQYEWLILLRDARDGRAARLRDRGKPDLPTDGDASGDPKLRGQAPGRKLRLGRHLPLFPIVTVVAVVVTIVVGAWVVDRLDTPQPQCATVAAEPSAPVWLEIGQSPIKYKRSQAQVRLYPARGKTETPQGTYQAVLLREDGRFDYGWMLDSHLQPAECNP